jgi:protein TonB
MACESGTTSRQELGSLRSCLVEGDPEQRARERRIRRKSLIGSVVLQGSLLTAVILAPLFAKPSVLLTPSIAPIPLYRQIPPHTQNSPRPTDPSRRVCIVCLQLRPADLTTNNRIPSTQPVDPLVDMSGDIVPGGSCVGSGCINLRMEGPRPPVATEPRREKPRIVHTQISAAMLIRRVEPEYPVLARQLGRPGRVELRAVIATDGTIQALQVVSGDPLFYESALAAVREWRYKPTVLNGEPVEIDTFITVIYNINH